MTSLLHSGLNQDLGKIEPAGATWVTSDHKHVMNQPYRGELGGVLASEVLGTLKSLLFFPNEILSCVLSTVYLFAIRGGPMKCPLWK